MLKQLKHQTLKHQNLSRPLWFAPDSLPPSLEMRSVLLDQVIYACLVVGVVMTIALSAL